MVDAVSVHRGPDSLLGWVETLESRHGASLTFAELRKGVVALSRIYVQGRARMGAGAAFDGAGKRAAFACFYTPLHFLTVSEIVTRLDASAVEPKRIVDLGCGLAPAGAAWASLCTGKPTVLGYDVSPWAVAEARHTLHHFGLSGKVARRSAIAVPAPRRGDAIIAAFTVNELSEAERNVLLERLLEAYRRRGASVLVIEPISRRTSPWWDEWHGAARSVGGRSDEWRFSIGLPPLLSKLDRAAGLDHSELTARSLFWGQIPET